MSLSSEAADDARGAAETNLLGPYLDRAKFGLEITLSLKLTGLAAGLLGQ